MKIKAVCQRCGEILTIDLNEARHINGWIYFHVNELIQILPEWQSWDVWFCGLCWSVLDEIKERLGEDKFNEYFEDLFKIEGSDKPEVS